MRLTKTISIIEKGTPVLKGYDSLGRPVYETPDIEIPLNCEIEPFSNQLAQTKYGVTVNVTNRVFCLPNDKIKLGVKMKYKNINYSVTQNMEYDHHFEVLINKV